MAQKRFVKSVVIALSIAFVASSIMIFVSPPVKGTVWTETTDVDFGNYTAINGLDILGNGTSAYMALKKDVYNWFNKNPASNPGQRYAFATVWDALNGKVFLFGGLNATSVVLNDTWSYTFATNTWTRIQANAPPPARYYSSMAFDSIHNVAVLYGGYDANSVLLDDTWEWNAVTGVWTNTTPATRPRLMTDNPMTFDTNQSKIILSAMGRTAWETWAYDQPTHTWTHRTGATTVPSQRAGHRLAYYPGIQKTVLYGGSFMLTSYAETWEYDYTADNWVDQSGNTGGTNPGYRGSFGFVYRPNTNELVLWGGFQSGTYPVDTWRYYASGGNRYWYSIPTPGNPVGRADLGLAYDTVDSVAIMFGGKDASTKYSDTWSFAPGYRAQGSYQSKVLNSHYGNTVWQNLFWNQTPAAVPAGGTIRFRIATSNAPDPLDPSWVFRGPDGTTGTYYTSPGTAIWPGASNNKYLMYAIQVLCSGCTDSPQVQDVSVQYYAPQVPPTVLSRGPETAGAQLYFPPINTPIWINFSEPMDTSKVTVYLLPQNVTLSYTWTDPDTSMLYLTHTQDLTYCTVYHPTITQAVDQQGQSMTGLPYSWTFVTFCPEPEITSTSPYQGQFDVPLTAPIWVNFSKPMNRTSVSVNVTPPLDTPSSSWSNGDKTLKVDHAGPLLEGTIYTVNVTGKDTNDKSLIPGSVPNPWTFESRFTSVRVLTTDPLDQSLEVILTSPVTIQFSHRMNISSVNVVISPTISTNKTWNSPTNDTLTMTHASPFVACTVYTFNVTGRDFAGNNLIGGYYMFWFFTSCGGSPYIVITQPMNGATEVALNQNIQFAFNEAMVKSSVTYTVQPADWNWTANWTNMDMVLTLEHVTPFQGCTKYFINVTGGRDVDENKNLVPGPVPNHFSFTTTCVNPFVRTIVPPNGAIQVPVNTNIVVTFSKQINDSSFIYRLDPDPGLIPSWNSPANTVFTLSHGPLFQQCTIYNLSIIRADDPLGHPLIGRSQFNFTTFCGINPHIVFTDPASGAQNVALTKSIVVRFDKSMDPNNVTYVIRPGGIVYQKSWTPDFKNLTLDHIMQFAEATVYNVTISGCDIDGYCLEAGPVSNPWEFTTLSLRPFITSTDPVDLATDVVLTKPIRVTFSKSMDPSSVTQIITPPGIVYTQSWSNLNKTLTLFHATPFNACSLYNVTIAGSDPLGNTLVQGPPSVPNPWKFTTTCAPGAPGRLVVHRVSNDVQLSWRAPTGVPVSGYRIYESANRLTSFASWNMIGNVTTTTFTHTNGNITGTHFYIVRAYNAQWFEGPNSTMGALLSRTFTFNPSGTNTQWFGLPYHTIYAKASDITAELTSAKINLVARYNSDKQQVESYYYFNGRWRGKNFDIFPGDGLELGVVSTFTWTINGTDTAYPLQFVYKPSAPTHVFWMSLPYTTSYVSASSISTELTSAKVTTIGRYNPSANTFEKWYWDGVNWVGTDFPILPGDGIYLVIVQTFNWTPKLITLEVP